MTNKTARKEDMKQVSKDEFFSFINLKDACYSIIGNYDEERGYTGHYKLRNGYLLGVTDGIEYKNNERYFLVN